MEKLLKQVKDSMRIKHSALDSSYKADIEAGLLDLKRVGVQPFQNDNEISENQLIRKAIELYCKGEADYQGKGEFYIKAYKSLRDSLSLSGDYK